MDDRNKVIFGGKTYNVEALTFSQIQNIGPAFWKATVSGDEDVWYINAKVMLEQALGITRDVIDATQTSLPEISAAVARIAIIAGLAKEPGEKSDAGEAPGEAPSI